jgi:hypothetical protein
MREVHARNGIEAGKQFVAGHVSGLQGAGGMMLRIRQVSRKLMAVAAGGAWRRRIGSRQPGSSHFMQQFGSGCRRIRDSEPKDVAKAAT